MTIPIDEIVDVPTLLEYPSEALHPVLKHLKGWEEVSMRPLCFPHNLDSFCRSIGCSYEKLSTCGPIAYRLASSHVGTSDDVQVAEEDIEAWQISGAMTNIIFRCQNLRTCQVHVMHGFVRPHALTHCTEYCL